MHNFEFYPFLRENINDFLCQYILYLSMELRP